MSSRCVRSKCADEAYKAGRLQEELTPVPLRNSKGEATGESLTEDDHRRPQTTMEGLAKLQASVWEKWDGDGRERQRDCRWRGGGGGDVAGAGAEAKSESAGTDCELGNCGRRSEDDGERSGAGDEDCAADARG